MFLLPLWYFLPGSDERRVKGDCGTIFWAPWCYLFYCHVSLLKINFIKKQIPAMAS